MYYTRKKILKHMSMQLKLNDLYFLSAVPHRQSEDLVTLSGHGSFSSEQPHQPLGRSRVSETNRPITHTSSIQGGKTDDWRL